MSGVMNVYLHNILMCMWCMVCVYSTCGVKASITLVWMLYNWLVPITPTGYGGLEGGGRREEQDEEGEGWRGHGEWREDGEGGGFIIRIQSM